MKSILGAETSAAALLAWAIAVVAAWLAVSTQFWAQTLLIGLLGVLLVLFAPSQALPRWPLVLACVLMLLAATAFLPASWFGTAYRDPFLAKGIVLPGTASCQPWISFEDLTLLVAAILWGIFCLSAQFSAGQREFLLVSFLLALTAVAGVRVLGDTPAGAYIPSLLQSLGQFENKNQTGDIYMMGGVLSFGWGLSQLTRKRVIGLAWILLTTLFFAAIVENASRASLLLFIAGLLFLSLRAPGNARHASAFRAILFSVAVVGLIIFVSVDSGLVAKFGNWLDGDEFRLPIYQDAISMISRVPWIGVGLGNFSGVFNTMREHSLYSQSILVHPESDWFWAAADLGLLSIVVLAALLICIARTFFSRSTATRLTTPCALLGVLFLLHTLCDVGGHRMGTAWSGIFLVSLGATSVESSGDVRIPPWIFRIMGLLLLGLVVLRIQSMSMDPWMPTRASVARIEEKIPGNLPPDVESVFADRATSWAPLDWQPYYARGVIALQQSQPASEISADFARALFLDQSSLEVPLAIGDACRGTDLDESVLAWSEVLKRAGDRREDLYNNLLHIPNLDLSSTTAIVNLAGSDPNLQAIAVWVCVQPAQFNWLLGNLLRTNPSLSGISPKNLQKLFHGWGEIGDPALLVQAWPQHPEWRDAGWKAYVLSLAKVGHYHDAVEIALEFLPPQSAPLSARHPELATAELLFHANPQDSYSGLMLYFAEMDAGRKDDALQTLTAIANLPSRPDYVPIILARQLADNQQDQAAWEALQPLIQ